VKNLLLIFSFLLTGSLFAQPEKEVLKEKLKEASFSQKFDVGLNLMYDKVYIDAFYVWEILLEEDPKNANLLYKSGMCLIELNKESLALPYFDKAQYSVLISNEMRLLMYFSILPNQTILIETLIQRFISSTTLLKIRIKNTINTV
jgi:hypothetical protein